MEAGSTINCTCVVENLDGGGQTLRRQNIKSAALSLGRNDPGDVALKIAHPDGSLGPFTVRQHAVHSRFAGEGKASIRLVPQRLQLLISNCPPVQLKQFLQSLSFKLAARGKLQGAKSSRLLPDTALGFDEISPLCKRDVERAAENRAKRNTSSLTTPKREETKGGRPPKRKLSDISNTSCTRRNDEVKTKEDDQCTSQQAKKRCPSTTAAAAGVLRGIHSNLSTEQLTVVEMVKNGESVFFTGSAGTGKSYLLKQIIGVLPPESTFATASTGSAACQIGGATLHSFAGIGIGSGSLEHCLTLASRPRKAAQWRKCNCLIIDEISMIDADYFDKLDAVAKAVRKSKKPFGGIQLVLCGDFLQLPPVVKDGEKKYCFQAKCWKWCVTRSVELTEIYRQRDKQFIALLQNIRIGRCPPAISKLLQATRSQQIERGGIKATRLFTHTADVEATNRKQLEALGGDVRKFPAQDSDPSLSSQLDSLCPVSSSIHLKEGAQVMLAKNIDVTRGLVNGARGVVTKFESSNKGLPVVRFISGVEMTMSEEKFLVKMGGGVMAVRRQLPLRLAWAISVHKSQGMTLDCVEISLGRAFEDGQAYVALSRARSLKSMRVIDFQPSCVRAHPAVLDYYRFLRRMRQNYISPIS